MVELVDTLDSKSCERKLVTVQVRPAAPHVSDVSRLGLRLARRMVSWGVEATRLRRERRALLHLVLNFLLCLLARLLQ